MKKLRLVALVAASTALIPAAMAQNAPNAHRGMSNMGAHRGPGVGAPNMAPRAGHSWGQGRMRAPQMRHSGPPTRMQRGGPPQMHHNRPPQVRHGGPLTHHAKPGNPHGGGHFKHRINRGGKVSHHWSGSRFHVRNWGLYGFPEPFVGGRWIRYYDDALLVDQYGRVYDGRYGMDWDRYGEPWEAGGDGIPAYAGDGDYAPDDRDYELAEDRDREEYLAEDGDYERDGRYPPPPPGYPPPPPPPGHGAYGYGACGCAYTLVPVLMTETIVTTAPVMESVTTYRHVRTKTRPALRSKDRPVVRYK